MEIEEECERDKRYRRLQAIQTDEQRKEIVVEFLHGGVIVFRMEIPKSILFYIKSSFEQQYYHAKTTDEMNLLIECIHLDIAQYWYQQRNKVVSSFTGFPQKGESYQIQIHVVSPLSQKLIKNQNTPNHDV